MKTEPYYVVASNRPWHESVPGNLSSSTGKRFFLARSQAEIDRLIQRHGLPRYIFFLHWGEKVPRRIHQEVRAVIFHMTDVPFGRGGSPLQNLVALGHTSTMLSALRCVEELDAGPVYLKRPLCLHGSAEEIFLRATALMEEMIKEIIESNPIPSPQRGEPTFFRRRLPEDGDLSVLDTLEKVYDWIRMLDAPGYPSAFLDFGPFRVFFKRSSFHHNAVRAEVEIRYRHRGSFND